MNKAFFQNPHTHNVILMCFGTHITQIAWLMKLQRPLVAKNGRIYDSCDGQI